MILKKLNYICFGGVQNGLYLTPVGCSMDWVDFTKLQALHYTAPSEKEGMDVKSDV